MKPSSSQDRCWLSLAGVVILSSIGASCVGGCAWGVARHELISATTAAEEAKAFERIADCIEWEAACFNAQGQIVPGPEINPDGDDIVRIEVTLPGSKKPIVHKIIDQSNLWIFLLPR